ncbi:Uncharacterized protein OS=Ktedonobacter racemifer DSM 44963 GN=Krac_12020 PE=4 SV=1 [Gemmata massiliana]|uniref:General stress protein 17M-like domain-containing protein n=1 Tax=Gemmata massiliana TaxID=1210884 RepID=A0A6P2D102_9BACT|nr:general stress protein [Gemmata massiliana]VTR93130.1 Uncharacterized protein OS=Ktedonobacter racemifer DSM 44963 GN=Krac_12020 PE=4 SV=1 [Gemmata massiliana]
MKKSNMSSAEMVTVVGVFPGYAEARRAIEALRGSGYQNEQIGVFGPDDRSSFSDDSTNTQWEDGAGIGAAVGGITGLGFGTAVAAGLMSPLGPVIAGGAIVALLASSVAGASIGTVVGALVGAGIPEDEAQWHASELETGHVVVTVRTMNATHVRNLLDEYGAINRPSAEISIPGNALPATPY